MITEIKSVAFSGVDVVQVNIQIHIQSGIPSFNIVGLPDKAVAESKERINPALYNLGIALPPKKIVVNLSPADLAKEGSHYDLPIILGILANCEIIPKEVLESYIIMGEISLDGKLISVPGVLPSAIFANQQNCGLICPKTNATEASLSGNKPILATSHISNIISHFKGEQKISYPEVNTSFASKEDSRFDMQDVIGQESTKRALEVAAAGKHNILMVGPPGSGKTMLAERMPSITPPLNKEKILENIMIRSLAGKFNSDELTEEVPFRSPHHTCSYVAMIGGGNRKRTYPGEITLAHNGILFLDEFPEYPKNVIESLRIPLEKKSINISRSNNYITYPTNFQLIAAMNPCKCGAFSKSSNNCSKYPRCYADYMNKISGPIVDRIDIFCEVSEISATDRRKFKDVPRETSKQIYERVSRAREIQKKRYKDEKFHTNSEQDTSLLKKYLVFSKEASEVLENITDKLKLSMRGYFKLQKLSQTIADLDESEAILANHVLEAANYRMKN